MTNDKCSDHDHRTGAYRGAACSDCNRRRQMSRNKLTVVMHNFKNYDVHHVVREGLNDMTHWNTSIIPLTFEKYLSLTARFSLNGEDDTLYCSIVFIDSYQFMSSSLSKLVEICSSMPYTASLNLPDSVTCGKGVFPYGYFSFSLVLQERQLPAKEHFYDVLTQSHISNDDYERAQQSWQAFKCQTLDDYMMAYLSLDVHQLADIFENFRNLSLKQDGLDPVYYFSTPSLSWDAAFKCSKVMIDLLLEEEQYNFFERGRRGGMTFVNKHYIKRNSPEDSDYNPEEDHTELLYIGKCVRVRVKEEHEFTLSFLFFFI
jgi:hypothetical protein